ncbi:CBS domain-containing protein [Chitinophagaceae bacterium MMS25-I14]
MLIEKLISPIVPTLLPTDTGKRALDLMEENHLTQLPLVIDDKYTALIQENDVLDWNTPERPLSGADFLLYKPAVFANGHPYDAFRIAHQQNLSVIPVIDRSNNYMGAITRDDLLKYITENIGLENPGGIIVLEIEPRSYSLTEVARICENEDVHLISTQLITNAETGMLELTLKTNRTELGAVVSSFERHGYNIKEIFGEQGGAEDMLSRYKLLMNYINM